MLSVFFCYRVHKPFSLLYSYCLGLGVTLFSLTILLFQQHTLTLNTQTTTKTIDQLHTRHSCSFLARLKNTCDLEPHAVCPVSVYILWECQCHIFLLLHIFIYTPICIPIYPSTSPPSPSFLELIQMCSYLLLVHFHLQRKCEGQK